ncbi:glycosyltransferase family 4 protein [Prosthecobacter sp.]|uniref:glycosyltransferase family 4 protein n=1 Tax=Prosthecobacter sp. TaxID=1965333 RepID=UPI0037832A47
MRLLIYAHYFAPSVGGVETVVLALAAGLSAPEHGHEVTVVTQTLRGVHDDEALRYRVVRRPSAWALWRLIRQADVVHVAGTALGPVLLGLLARRPLVVEHHGFQSICPNGQLVQEPRSQPCPGHFMAGRHGECLRCSPQPAPWMTFRLWLLTFARRWMCRRVDVNVVPTSWLGRQIKLPRTETVLHGVALPEPQAAREPDASRILFIGRLVRPKGVHLLLEAVQSLHAQGLRFQTWIVGSGPERPLLEAGAGGGAAEVKFFGGLPEEKLDALRRQVCVVVVPSLGGEVFGMVVLENMAQGLPVLASDIGAFAEVIGEGGVTFQTGDAVDLAAKLSAMLKDHKLRARLAAAALRRAAEVFSQVQMVEGHARIYRRLAEGASSNARKG